MKNFKIEGIYPPAIFKSPTTGISYAICGSNWVEITNDFTIADATKGWICTAKDSIKTEKIVKRKTKKELLNDFVIKFKKC